MVRHSFRSSGASANSCAPAHQVSVKSAAELQRLERFSMTRARSQITGLLKAWAGGDDAALEELIPAVYNELRKTARRYMRNESPGNTLQPTALVNEVYLRLVNIHDVTWHDR